MRNKEIKRKRKDDIYVAYLYIYLKSTKKDPQVFLKARYQMKRSKVSALACQMWLDR